jgi:hypothetical protein
MFYPSGTRDMPPLTGQSERLAKRNKKPADGESAPSACYAFLSHNRSILLPSVLVIRPREQDPADESVLRRQLQALVRLRVSRSTIVEVASN